MSAAEEKPGSPRLLKILAEAGWKTSPEAVFSRSSVLRRLCGSIRGSNLVPRPFNFLVIVYGAVRFELVYTRTAEKFHCRRQQV